MSKPTKNQIEADKFDAALFRLIFKSIDFSADKSWTRKERHDWDAVRQHLTAARPFVRFMMHPDRCKETDAKP